MKKIIFTLFFVLFLSGCASNSASVQLANKNDSIHAEQYDPLEPLNRPLWDFNWQILDQYLLRPTTVAYVNIIPQFARMGLRNMAINLEEPGNTVNNLLQAKGKRSLTSLSRFAINSTLGLFGFFDIASKMGLTRQDEDFDETLALWGINGGPFLMVPVLGPNDTRGLIGDITDNVSYPMTIISSPLNIGRILINIIETRASLMAQEEQILKSADDYAFVRNAYFQNKAFTIRDGNLSLPSVNEDELEDFEAFESLLESEDGDGKKN